MNKWNDHSKLEGTHAFLGASQYHWINWNDETLEKRFVSQYSQELGTVLHEFACNCIKKKIKLNKSDKHLIEYVLVEHNIPRHLFDIESLLDNIIPFVNDCIGYHMSPEVLLYYSMVCYGTTDAIGYDEINKTLRIHDLKTGSTPAHIEQLLIYAALFCLEYKVDPYTLKNITLCIYQSSEVSIYEATPEEINKFIDIIKTMSSKALKILERNIG